MRIESINELNEIREKITRKAVDYNQRELLCLTAVYADITKQSIGKAMILDMSCSSCIKEAVNIAHNFVKFHEIPEPSKETQAKITIVDVNKDVDLNELSLSELREMYPHIKSTSKKGFMAQL